MDLLFCFALAFSFILHILYGLYGEDVTISMYPQLWGKCGKIYSKLLDELIENAKNA